MRAPGCRARCETGIEEDRLRREALAKIKKAKDENRYFEERARARK